MNSRIPENLQLLGLITTTRPFSYENNIVKSSVEIYIERDELLQIKQQLEDELKLVSATDDTLKQQLDADIYFIDRILQTLEVN